MNQDRINRVADCTMDHQFVHVDPVRFLTTVTAGRGIRATAKILAVM
jgi:acyl dehydratase